MHQRNFGVLTVTDPLTYKLLTPVAN